MKYVGLIKKCNIKKITKRRRNIPAFLMKKNGIECKEQFSHFIFK